jgi:hypothetical protein
MVLENHLSVVDTLPFANWPASSGTYEVVQLMIENMPILRLGDARKPTHGDILMDLARLLGKDCPLEEKNVCGWGYAVPAPQSDWYQVQGMGYVTIDQSAKTATFSDKSDEYNLGISKEHLSAMRQLLPGWILQNS